MIAVPKKLYKYRAINKFSLTEVESNVVHYADPTKFNDPLDCSPVVEVDIPLKDLEHLCFRMFVQRFKPKGGMEAAKKRANREIGILQRLSTDVKDPRNSEMVEARYHWWLSKNIEGCLNLSMKRKGVLSLAKKWNCPLMWSHYADQHNGICLEYDTSDCAPGTLVAINYSGQRGILASDLYAWHAENDEDARQRIHEGYFYKKTSQWKYEKEWRIVNETNGTTDSAYPITAIYFGIRCEYSIKAMLVKLFVSAECTPKFYEIYEDRKTFKLHRGLMDTDEIFALSPRRSPYLDFTDISKDAA